MVGPSVRAMETPPTPGSPLSFDAVTVAVVEDHTWITPCAWRMKFACAALPPATLTVRLVRPKAR